VFSFPRKGDLVNADTVEPWHDFLLPSSSAGELEHDCVILDFSQFGFEFV